ncbi:MAG: VOC family protein [Pseudomonadota bacterium]
MISHVSFASLNVTDLDRAKAFWSEIVGFEETVDMEAIPGMRWVMLRPGQAETQLHLWKVDEVPQTGMPALPFVDPDVEATVEALRGKGVEIVQEPGPAEWDASTIRAIFRDSEGNQILLASR